MVGFVLALHVLICLLLVVVVLLQSGKGGGLAGAFGGGGQAVFGGRGAATVLTRATMVLGGLFFITSLTLALSSGQTPASRSLLQEEARRAAPAQGTAPGSPATLPAPGTPQPGSPLIPQGSPASPAPATPAPAPAPSGGR
jgi:preprotein translocase subunit SecG